MGFPRQEYWSKVAISFFKRSYRPRDQTRVSYLASEFFTTDPPGKPIISIVRNKFLLVTISIIFLNLFLIEG